MEGISVRQLGINEYNLWDELVSTSPQGTIFHSTDWLQTNSESLQSKIILLGAFDRDQLVGGCCLYEHRTRYRLKIAVTNVPLTPYSGFLVRHCESGKVDEQERWNSSIISAVSEKIHCLRYLQIRIVNTPALMDNRPLLRGGWKPSVHYTYLLPLDPDPSTSFSRTVERNIKKAHKEGIYISTNYDPEVMWELQVKTYGKQNLDVPYPKKQLFKLIDMVLRTNRGGMWMATTCNGTPVSAECIIWDKQGAYRWLAASDPDYLNTGATYLLLSEVIKSLRPLNTDRLYMMAANTDKLSTFASNFNPRLIPYYGFIKSCVCLPL